MGHAIDDRQASLACGTTSRAPPWPCRLIEIARRTITSPGPVEDGNASSSSSDFNSPGMPGLRAAVGSSILI
jgi:hypothetical protein